MKKVIGDWEGSQIRIVIPGGETVVGKAIRIARSGILMEVENNVRKFIPTMAISQVISLEPPAE